MLVNFLRSVHTWFKIPTIRVRIVFHNPLFDIHILSFILFWLGLRAGLDYPESQRSL